MFKIGGGKTNTTTRKVLLSLNAGDPESVTRTVTSFVVVEPPPGVVHVNKPLAGSMPAPGGEPASRLKASGCVGRSASIAVAVKESVSPALTVLSPIAANTG